MMEEKVMNRWLVVMGAVMVQMCLGAIYAWSVFTGALQEAGWTAAQTQVVFSVALVSYALSMVGAGFKLNVVGPRKMAILGGLILGTGYIIAGLFGGTNFWMLLIFIGIVGGTGIGVGYVVPIAVGMRWFPDKKGLITGLAVAGFGLGAMLWVKLAGTTGNLIANFGLPTTFVILGVLFAVFVTIGGLFMVFPPEGWLPEGYVPETGEAGSTQVAGVEYGAGEMVKTPQFWMIFFTFAFLASAGLMSIGLMQLYPMEALMNNGMDRASAVAVAGTAMAVFFSIANALGRVAWGSISDILGRKNSLIILAFTQGLGVMAFTYMAGTPMLLYIGAALIGFNFGGTLSLFPTLTADTFGSQNVGRNYPLVFLAYGAGALLGPNLGGVMGGMGNFALAFTICGVLCIMGGVLTVLLRPPRRCENVENCAEMEAA
ncbi:OFA family MFS transporter [Desulfobotulus sp. H1]|uniref:OFA family MFS transporter n=1 Tax=Desulfobotulus pelophilus TaxID=2823377 RepID=A0ABT3N742_9BACT|nr:OFA family MFS transporter [Desulfobotulus pelophilus]MCW7753275.1 OFA family MFS transporter [Desulfobotulus pelophilus]